MIVDIPNLDPPGINTRQNYNPDTDITSPSEDEKGRRGIFTRRGPLNMPTPEAVEAAKRSEDNVRRTDEESLKRPEDNAKGSEDKLRTNLGQGSAGREV